MENKEKIVVVGVSVFFGIGCLKVGRDRELRICFCPVELKQVWFYSHLIANITFVSFFSFFSWFFM